MGSVAQRNVLDAVDCIGKCRSRSEVKAVFYDAVASLGVSSVLISEIPPPGLGLEQFTVLNGWPPGWFDEYKHEKYYEVDEVLAKARTTTEPFKWSDVSDRTPANSATRRVMKAASAYGLDNGIVVPIYGTHGDQYGVTMGGSSIDFGTQSVQALQLLAVYAHYQAQKAAPRWATPHPTASDMLSWRESECLRWAASGKSNWEMAQIMEISKHTVDTHIRKAMLKLGAHTRTQAVAKALASNMIAL